MFATAPDGVRKNILSLVSPLIPDRFQHALRQRLCERGRGWQSGSARLDVLPVSLPVSAPRASAPGPAPLPRLACVSRSLAGRRRDRGRVSSLCRRKFRVTEHTRDRVFYQHSSAYQQRQPHQARRRRVFTLRLETLSGSTAPNSALTVTVDDRHERYTASNTPVPPHVPVDTRR